MEVTPTSDDHKRARRQITELVNARLLGFDAGTSAPILEGVALELIKNPAGVVAIVSLYTALMANWLLANEEAAGVPEEHRASLAARALAAVMGDVDPE